MYCKMFLKSKVCEKWIMYVYVWYLLVEMYKIIISVILYVFMVCSLIVLILISKY